MVVVGVCNKWVRTGRDAKVNREDSVRLNQSLSGRPCRDAVVVRRWLIHRRNLEQKENAVSLRPMVYVVNEQVHCRRQKLPSCRGQPTCSSMIGQIPPGPSRNVGHGYFDFGGNSWSEPLRS